MLTLRLFEMNAFLFLSEQNNLLLTIISHLLSIIFIINQINNSQKRLEKFVDNLFHSNELTNKM